MTPLRRRMIEDMQVRNLAPLTQRSYLQQISQFARHFGKSPELLGPDDIRTYQIHLSQDRQLSASSMLVAVAAIRFLYKCGWRSESAYKRRRAKSWHGSCRNAIRAKGLDGRPPVNAVSRRRRWPKASVVCWACPAAWG